MTIASRSPAVPGFLTSMERALETAGTHIQSDPRDFLPALMRLEQSPPSPLGRRVLWVMMVFLAALLIWAFAGRLDIVAVAEGKLVPLTYLKIVQPTDAGVVKEILVREGERVKAGQILMRMDAALSDSDLKSLSADAYNKRLALRRIDAQLAGQALTRARGDPPELFTQVEAQYHANRRAYENAQAQERSLLDKARHDLVAASEVKSKLLQTLPHYRDQEAAYEKLMKDGFAGKLMYTDKQRERVEKEQDLRAQESIIASAQATIAQQERKLEQTTADYRRQLQTERVDIAAQLEKSTQELNKQTHRHGYLELKAPQDGVVKDLATHTVGTVASPGTIMMTLVPKDELLRAEVWVKNDDIGFVRPTQTAKLKLATYSFQKYGMVDGEVELVSEDASEAGSGTQGASPGQAKNLAAPLTYKTLVDLKSQFMEINGERHRLAPGMQVVAEINLGTRTVMEYLLSPVRKTAQEAARER